MKYWNFSGSIKNIQSSISSFLIDIKKPFATLASQHFFLNCSKLNSMKKLFPIAILMLCIFACNPDEKVKETTLIIHAENVDSASNYLLIMDYEGFQNTIHQSGDGSFIYKFDTIKHIHRYFIPRDRKLIFAFIDNYETVEVHTDFNDFDKSAKFSGDRADMNNYYADRRNIPDIIGYDRSFYSGPFDECKAWADANLKTRLDFLNSYEKNDPDNVFWTVQEANIKFIWADRLEDYPVSHARIVKEQTLSLPDDYLDFRKELDFNNPDYLGSSGFTSYLGRIVEQKSEEENPELEGIEAIIATLQTADEMIENSEVRDFIWVDIITEKLRRTPLSSMEPFISYFRENQSSPKQLERLNDIYKEWKKLDAGQPGFDFVAEDLEGNEVRFSDFAGKYVYIDVWATWCGPCIKEIPYLKELEKDYHGRNILFVSYSIDADKQKWLDFIPENELGGVQIIGDDAWKSSATKYYKVTAVPTFMFFGPDGKIINRKMTRPSNPETRKAFDSYSDL